MSTVMAPPLPKPRVSEKQSCRAMLHPLTSWRFVAAFMVFIWHTHLLPQVLDRYQLGYAGVGFFYLLSGFILTHVYFEKLRRPSFSVLASFYAARVAKLFPVHLLTFALSLPLAIPLLWPKFPHHPFRGLAMMAGINLALLQSYFPAEQWHFSFNAVSWSLSDELFFYLSLPLLVWLLARSEQRITIPRLVLGMALLWGTLLLFLSRCTAGLDEWSLYILPPARLPEFAAGILLGLIYRQITASPTGTLDWLPAPWVLETGALALLGGGLALVPHLPQALRFGAWLLPFWSVVILVFALQCGALSQMLSWRPLVFLGEISFSFYMLHELVLRYTAQTGVPQVVLISFLLTLVLSAAVFLLYEEPARKLVKRRLEGWLRPGR